MPLSARGGEPDAAEDEGRPEDDAGHTEDGGEEAAEAEEEDADEDKAGHRKAPFPADGRDISLAKGKQRKIIPRSTQTARRRRTQRREGARRGEEDQREEQADLEYTMGLARPTRKVTSRRNDSPRRTTSTS